MGFVKRLTARASLQLVRLLKWQTLRLLLLMSVLA